MPSFQDSAVIFIIALLLFGPRKLPELARQLGKLMGEFRRASNDFRMLSARRRLRQSRLLLRSLLRSRLR
jgi:TatA/E family protein of Tat protein translocase